MQRVRSQPILLIVFSCISLVLLFVSFMMLRSERPPVDQASAKSPPLRTTPKVDEVSAESKSTRKAAAVPAAAFKESSAAKKENASGKEPLPLKAKPDALAVPSTFPQGQLVARFCPHPRGAHVKLVKGRATIFRLGELVFIEADGADFEAGVEFMVWCSGDEFSMKPRTVKVMPRDVKRQAFRLVVLIPPDWEPDPEAILPKGEAKGPNHKVRVFLLCGAPETATASLTSGRAAMRRIDPFDAVEATPADAENGIEVTVSAPGFQSVVFELDPRMFYEAGIADLALPPMDAKKVKEPLKPNP